MNDKKDEEDKEFEKILQAKIRELGITTDNSINEIVIKLKELHKKGIENNESVNPNELSAILGYEIIESPELQRLLASRREHTFGKERDGEYVAHIANLLKIPSTEQSNEQISGDTKSIDFGKSQRTAKSDRSKAESEESQDISRRGRAESEESKDIRRADEDIKIVYRSGKLKNIDEKTFNRTKSIIQAYNAGKNRLEIESLYNGNIEKIFKQYNHINPYTLPDSRQKLKVETLVKAESQAFILEKIYGYEVSHKNKKTIQLIQTQLDKGLER